MKFEAPFDVEVHLLVDGQYLPEYGDDADATPTPNKQSTYVEATSGSIFSIEVRFGPRFAYHNSDISCAISLDGHGATSRIFYPKGNDFACVVNGVWTSQAGQWSEQKFTFADLETGKGQGVQMCHL